MKQLYLSSLLFLSSYSFCQVSIDDLDHQLFGVRLNALEIIMNQGLVEYIPEIQNRLFDQPTLTMQFAFLDALMKLEYEEIESLTLEFIDNTDNFQYPEDDPLYYKVMATEILFSIENYSTVQFVFDLLNRDLNFVDPVCLNLLNEIILNIPTMTSQATAELVRIFNNYNIDDNLRYSALKILNETNYPNILNLALSVVVGDESPEIRIYSNGIIRGKNYIELHDLYVQQLSVDPEPTIRSKYATSLLSLFGEPFDLKTVIDYLPNEPNETIQSFIGIAIDDFIPPKPDTLNWYGLATRLITYTDELLDYEWIANETIRAFYETKLNDIIEAVQSNKVGKACNIINNTSLPTIEQHLGNNSITREGYKFLHYYTLYIKEEIEDQYGACP